LADYLKLRDPSITPPCGYKYTDPETHLAMSAPTLAALITKVRRHRAANQLSVDPELSAVIEDAVCRQCPPNFVRNTPRKGQAPRENFDVRRSTVGVIKSTYLAIKRAEGYSLLMDFVSRMKVCRKCPENVKEPCCYSCYADMVFAPHVGKTYSEALKFFGVCNCDGTFLKVAMRLNAPGTFVGSEYPDECWKKLLQKEDV
jgi:hypothetical protein